MIVLHSMGEAEESLFEDFLIGTVPKLPPEATPN